MIRIWRLFGDNRSFGSILYVRIDVIKKNIAKNVLSKLFTQGITISQFKGRISNEVIL